MEDKGETGNSNKAVPFYLDKEEAMDRYDDVQYRI
jgi:hypothetical protein